MRRANTIFMVLTCWAICLFTLVGSAGAQETTTPAEDQYTSGDDAECPGAEVVNTTTGTGNKQSAPFQITGDRFRLTVTNNPTSSDPSLSGVTVYVVDADSGDDVASFNKEGAGQESSVINQGPGSFYIDTNTANADYKVVVEDCTGSTGTGGGSTGGGSTGGGSGGQQPGAVDNPKGVLPGTPTDEIPDTGGPPYLTFGALALLGGALIAGRGILRR